MERRRWAKGALFLALLPLALLSHPGDARGFPVRTSDAGTGVFAGSVALGRGIFFKASDGRADLRARLFPAVFSYSPTTNSAFRLVLPYVEKELKVPRIGREVTRGLGDLTLLGKYRFLDRVGPGVSRMAAFELGLKLPTGATGRSVDRRLPFPTRRMLQPGSGSADLSADLSFSRTGIYHNLFANLAYRWNGRDDGLRFGDRLFTNLDLETFLFPDFTRRHSQELLALVELSYVHGRRDRFRGRRLPNSGGDTLFVAPGLQWITGGGRLLLEVSVQLPLFQYLRGSQPEADYDLLFGLRFAY